MKIMKRVLIFFLCLSCLLGAAACGGQEEEASESEAFVTPEPTEAPTPTPEPTATPKPTATPEPSPTPYVSPIDFAALQAVNPDIYAWVKVDDTKIDYPVLQHPSEDEFYLHHDSDGNYADVGAIFSQATYNGRSFTDPVTILYGHNMASGAMFGTLRQSFTDQGFFDSHKVIKVYTPGEYLEFKVFAAVPYSDELIPYEHNFADQAQFLGYFDSIFGIRDLSARFDEANRPAWGDRVVILSTCISGTPMRFLVMGTVKAPEDPLHRSES